MLIFNFVLFSFSKVVTDLNYFKSLIICHFNNFYYRCMTSYIYSEMLWFFQFEVQYSFVNESTLCPLRAHLINPEVILNKVITFIISSQPCLLL